jgi:LmbE family N-acetylglucosaminyl deacetylase
MSDIDQVASEDDSPAKPEPPRNKRILAIYPHPDDAEFTCAGTLARWADEGNETFLCLVTDGGRGSDSPDITPAQLTETRMQEQQDAAALLGIREVFCLGRQDGTVVHDLDLRRDLTRVLRKVRPDIVICGDPSVYWHGNEYINHPDHRATADAALAAIFPSSGNRLYFPELLVEGLEPWKIREVYISSPAEPDTWIDISAYTDTKIAALRAHKCQMGDWDPDEPIREWNAKDGKKHDPPVAYAEDYRYFKISG